jgi:tetratricopeptide (TPR) repeat protein
MFQILLPDVPASSSVAKVETQVTFKYREFCCPMLADHPTVRDLLTPYATALDALEKSTAPTSAQVLSVLIARDAIHEQGIATQLNSDAALTLIQLDSRLRQLAGKITTAPLADWRDSLKRSAETWWWNLQAPPHRLDRFDWLWNAFTLASLTGSAGLVMDISSKFLSVTPGLWGSFAVIGQSVLTLVTAGGVFTDVGKRGIEQALASLGVRQYLWQETKMGLSLLLLLTMSGFRASLPQISQVLTGIAQDNRSSGDLALAETDLQRAVKLDPKNAEAQYQLGNVYADLERTEQAQEQYQIAVQAGIPGAFRALASLYLDSGNTAEAVATINQGLSEIPATAETVTVRSQLYTQLAQARFTQGRFDEAQESLRQATDLLQQQALERTPSAPDAGMAPEPTTTTPSNADLGITSTKTDTTTPAAPFCLLAEILEKQNQPQAALSAWQSCLSLADNRNAQEDIWIGMARDKLNIESSTPEKPPATEVPPPSEPSAAPSEPPPSASPDTDHYPGEWDPNAGTDSDSEPGPETAPDESP